MLQTKNFYLKNWNKEKSLSLIILMNIIMLKYRENMKKNKLNLLFKMTILKLVNLI